MATHVVTLLPLQFHLNHAEKLITRDEKSLFTIVSYIAVIIIYINLSQLKSTVMGVMASAIYFVVNGVFLGRAFFREEKAFLRLLLGLFSLVIILGLVGWTILVVYNLDEVRTLLVLVLVTTSSSLLNRRKKTKDDVQ